ncbi:MAG: DNA repair protein RecO [Oscillospiraceae bacterium]|nr:DNA repair protein RecO [Oscillospiraceae bacterium]
MQTKQTRILEGVVILEHPVGENDKFITVLTHDIGRAEIYVRGANKITSRNHAATQLYAFSKFSVTARDHKFILTGSELIHDFYNIRLDIKKLSLACYISDVMRYAVTSNNSQHESIVTRLVLNCLYMLDTDKRSCQFVKSVFELRFMSEIGFIPMLLGCDTCYTYTAEEMYFAVDKSKLYCAEHFFEQGFEENVNNIKITPSVLNALQYICLSEFDKLFNFKLSERGQAVISEIAEKYLCTHLSRNFRSLSYYHSV